MPQAMLCAMVEDPTPPLAPMKAMERPMRLGFRVDEDASRSR